MEHRSHKGSVELRENGSGGPVIAGYAAVFNRDSSDMGFIEQVDPRAFDKTIREADVRALGNHEPDWLLGRSKSGTLRLNIDSIGLGYEIDINPADPDGQRMIEKVRRGDMDGASFSFQTIRDEWNWEAQPPQRRLLEVALMDVGPVTWGAYPDATSAMRSALEPLAKRCGHDVTDLVTAMQKGEIRSLVDARKEPTVEPETTPHPVAAALDELAESSLDLAVELRAGARLSKDSQAMIQAAMNSLRDLLAEADGEPDEDGEAEQAARSFQARMMRHELELAELRQLAA